MIRKLLLPILLVVICVSGCGGTVYDPDSVTEGYAMARINGELYYDTGRASEIEGRCGNVDGTLEKTGKADEIPQEDGKCNFDGAAGWQTGTVENEKEICVDGNWKVFKKIDDPFTDLTQYKYCKRMQGTLPDAEIEDNLLVLTNDRKLDYNDVMDYYLSAETVELDFYVISLEVIE